MDPRLLRYSFHREAHFEPRLLCYSFHSAKGGVGKSTLSTLCARALARVLGESDTGPPLPVVLIDMDLTGTSLADVLPLCAPRWPQAAPGDTIDLQRERPADLFFDREETRDIIEVRQDALAGRRTPVGVPFLNDYLLFATRDWRRQEDVPVDAMLWREEGGFSNLRIVPSSALPDDLERILPIVYDEERAAYLEARLQALVTKLIVRYERVALVIDTPPTIPGLSRSMLSLALRIGRPQKLLLADDAVMPSALDATEVRWQAHMVSTPDFQDLRAMRRWLDLVLPDEQEVIRFVINRCPALEPGDRDRLLKRALARSANALAGNPLWIEDRETIKLFQDDNVEPGLKSASTEEDVLELLADGPAWLQEGR